MRIRRESTLPHLSELLTHHYLVVEVERDGAIAKVGHANVLAGSMVTEKQRVAPSVVVPSHAHVVELEIRRARANFNNFPVERRKYRLPVGRHVEVHGRVDVQIEVVGVLHLPLVGKVRVLSLDDMNLRPLLEGKVHQDFSGRCGRPWIDRRNDQEERDCVHGLLHDGSSLCGLLIGSVVVGLYPQAAIGLI